jgi:Glutamine amidotransferase domain
MAAVREGDEAAVVESRCEAGGERRMSGLVAIVSSDPREPVDESLLEGFTRTYEELRGVGAARTAAGPRVRVALLSASADEPPELEGDSDAWCAVVGRAYSPTSLAESRLNEIDGQFALVSYDGRTDEIRIATDAFGMQALYVAVRGSRLYVSTSVLALATFVRAAPNRFALEVFLRAGYHFGALTNWEGIERVEPGTCITVAAGQVSRHVYWRPAVDRSVASMSLAEAADHCAELAASEFGRRYADREPLWVDLTGGFDSRLLALLLDRAGAEFVCNTRGASDDADRSIAGEIAEVKQWELFDPVLPRDWADTLPGFLPHALAWGDGNLEVLELAWVLWVHRKMGTRLPVLMIGGGGEHWRGFAWSQEFLQAGRSTNVNMRNWIDMRLLHPMDLTVLARDPTPAIRDDFRARMLAWSSPYSQERNTVQLDILYAYKMTGHFGAYRSADAGYLLSELPFYLKEPWAAAISVDHRSRANHRLMRQVISRLDPAAASIRTTSGGPAVPWRPGTMHRFAPYYARIARRAVTKLAQVTLGRPFLALPEDDWWLPPAARRAVINVLGHDAGDRRNGMRSLSLYDVRALEDFFATPPADGSGDAELLGRIVTVELALRAADASLD